MSLIYWSLATAVVGIAVALAALVKTFRERPDVRLGSIRSRLDDQEVALELLESKFKKLNLRLNSAIYREKALDDSSSPPASQNPNDRQPGESREQWENRIRQKFLHGVN